MIGFGNNTNIGSAKYVPYLYDRIKSIVLGFTNTSIISADLDNILIPCEADGSNPVFTNSDNTFRVFYGGVNQTSNWTIDVLSETDVTTSQVDNTISITAIAADEGEYTVRAVRTDYTTITKVIKVYKAKLSGQGLDGTGITVAPSTIHIPSDYDGGNPVYTNAISTINIYRGASDETSSWSFAIQSVTDVTAAIQNDNEVIISAISDDEGEVTARATRTGYSDLDIIIPVYKVKNGEDGEDGTGIVQNVNLSLEPTDDGTPSGNARGSNSLDLQTSRTINTQVASGTYCVICGGGFNVVAGSHNFTGGGFNNSNAGNDNVIPGGLTNSIDGGTANAIGGGNANAISGSINYSTIAGGQTNAISGGYSQVLGCDNTITDTAATSIGIGGTSTTNGEIILSSSESAVQKSIFILEEQTSATGWQALQVLGRSSTHSGSAQTPQMVNSTAFTGYMDITGIEVGVPGNLFREKYAVIITCDSSGNILFQLSTNQDSGTNTNEYSASVGSIAAGIRSNSPAQTNNILIEVNVSTANTVNWVCLLEGIIMDI